MTKRLLQHFTILILVILSRTKSQSLPRCSDKCGNITIPYPFGIEEDCYLDIFYRVNCTTLSLYGSPFTLVDISLDGFLRGVLPTLAYSCYNSTHKLSGSDLRIWTSKFYISSKMNLLTTVGCDARADIMTINDVDYITGGASRSRCIGLHQDFSKNMRH
ncbi:putative wall-associated receptor kinase, galacturonan-binding domain-containing protein [Helianthus annuus]|nr:putative wall-associated receptor kinase, galacturonan-binding domain-containing protein [Helianthus annuus]